MLSESDCIFCLQGSCLLPLILMNSCQSMVKMSSMPTVAKTWGIWTLTSLLWPRKPTSRWPGKNNLSPEVLLGRVRGKKREFLPSLAAFAQWWSGDSGIEEESWEPNQLRFFSYFLSFLMSSSYSCEPEPWLGEQWLLRLISVLSNAVNA